MTITSFEAWDHYVQENGANPDHGPSDYGDITAEYSRLREDVGIVEFSGRTKIEMTGSDRVRFLHNLCTNDIQSLQVGYGCEAFVTSIQARIVGHVLVFATKDSLVINTVPAQYEKLSAHLDHFRIIDAGTKSADVSGILHFTEPTHSGFQFLKFLRNIFPVIAPVSYTHLRAHETDS